MSQLIRDFQEHPRSVGESYVEHWLTAMGFAWTLARCAFVCAVHAFVPGLFKHSASRCITQLHEHMVTQRRRRE
jgi:hypothetical protein